MQIKHRFSNSLYVVTWVLFNSKEGSIQQHKLQFQKVSCFLKIVSFYHLSFETQLTEFLCVSSSQDNWEETYWKEEY